MKKLILIVIIVLVGLVVLDNLGKQDGTTPPTPGNPPVPVNETATAKNSILGTAVSPANFPNSSDADIKDFFNQAAQIGGHITLISQWEEVTPTPIVSQLVTLAHQKGLKFRFELSPTALDSKRNTPSIPSGLGKSFTDQKVRDAFKAKALELAGTGIDQLGLATEINFLVTNQKEWDAFVTLERETYTAVKAQYPSLPVTVSFQWDVMSGTNHPEPLTVFKGAVDIYSFTSYPSDHFKDPAKMPADYYSKIRTYLPSEKVAFSEVGWSTKGSNEETQAAFYTRLPELMRGINPQFVTLALLNDVKSFGGALGGLNSVGIRNADGSPKASWNTINDLQF